jgi:hypothetical protein
VWGPELAGRCRSVGARQAVEVTQVSRSGGAREPVRGRGRRDGGLGEIEARWCRPRAPSAAAGERSEATCRGGSLINWHEAGLSSNCAVCTGSPPTVRRKMMSVRRVFGRPTRPGPNTLLPCPRSGLDKDSRVSWIGPRPRPLTALSRWVELRLTRRPRPVSSSLDVQLDDRMNLSNTRQANFNPRRAVLEVPSCRNLVCGMFRERFARS